VGARLGFSRAGLSLRHDPGNRYDVSQREWDLRDRWDPYYVVRVRSSGGSYAGTENPGETR